VTGTSAAEMLAPLVESLAGPHASIAIRGWDGSRSGPDDAVSTIVIESPDAIRRLLYAPRELGLARAFVMGDLVVEGDLLAALYALRPDGLELAIGVRTLAGILRTGLRLGVIGRPLPRPPEESRLRGRMHTKGRDADAISHHYDVSNDFYALFLGSTMTYSCARFVSADDDLDAAQLAKYDLVAGKLGLQEGMRLLDVGCGWGGMVMRAAEQFGVHAVGITISHEQADLARKRVAEAGLTDRVEIREQDYRDLGGEQFDAVSSIGMFEHVGREGLADYFGVLTRILTPTGRLLNHAISTPGGSRIDPKSFIGRYVFPDGELQDVATVVRAMEDAGLEARDVESLREHYALTLRQWVRNLEDHWDDAVELVGEHRARIWRLYMTGSIVGFETGDIGLHQVLGVKPGAGGVSGMPATRQPFERSF
jgi:cyclopropane-fatty-acyl-phospholipid synthase